MKRWYEDEDFWRAVRPVLFPPRRIQRAKEEVQRIVELLEVRPPDRVLDLACGVGRHSLELARQGFRVVGVDRTRPYIEEARARARRDGLSVEFVEGDMRDFCRPESFEGAFLFFTSFGFFEDRSEDRKVLENLWSSLVPGGRILLEMRGKEVMARTYVPVPTWYEGEGVYLLEEVRVEAGWDTVRTRWTVVASGRVQAFTFRLRLYSAREIRDMLEDVGFEDVRVYGGLKGEPYDHTAQRLVVVARRSEGGRS